MLKSIWYILIVTGFFSCKKSGTDGQSGGGAPMSLPHGTPTGAVVKKTIGPSGGSIQNADQTVNIYFPPGALSEATEISIQPVSTTMESVTGTVYRLGPENVTFQKDVYVTFKYTDDNLQGTSEDLLYLAYQNREGYWARSVRTEINKQSKELTAATTHFSDWAMERVFYLSTGRLNPTLSANEELNLKVEYSDVSGEDLVDDLLAPVIPVPGRNIEAWFVNGPGTVSNDKSAEAVYRAPASITEATTVAVGVRIKGLVGKTHPERPGTSGIVIIQLPVELVPEEFFTWDFNGTKNTALATDGALLGSSTNIIGTGLLGGVSLVINATKAGDYELGNPAAPDFFNLQLSVANQTEVIYLGTYRLCNDPTTRYGKGKVIISSYGSVGGFIKGSFTATVYNPGSGCSPAGKPVTGNFKVKRKV